MKKGGYQILDLKGVELTTMSGDMDISRYEALQNAHGKPILVSGIVIDGEKKHDVFVTPVLEEDSWIIELYGYTLHILDDGDVLLTSKIIEFDTPYQVVSGDMTQIVEEELYVLRLPNTIFGNINLKDIKRVYDSLSEVWLDVFCCNEQSFIRCLTIYSDLGTISKVELY